ncbi:hypothetical protein BVC80_259g6 [Macleaya cordata]|uniref:Reverse transcriptase zinc-binding domain n=1 Tax=Macleaya cordata TaxID=56857 RepID=A0A200Q8C5_MACCD|nr:hypothetical protein BVC80_259g6 [Macleaya cordata]
MGRMGMAGILSKVGDGRRIKFWHDNWLTETPLADRFKSLFRVSRKKNESVCDFLTIDEEGRLEWDLDLPRRLGDTEATEFTELQMLLSSYVLNEGEDGRSWRWEKNGSFTVRSCYDAIHTGGSDSFSHANIWNKTGVHLASQIRATPFGSFYHSQYVGQFGGSGMTDTSTTWRKD